jgi:hypothetical protein
MEVRDLEDGLVVLEDASCNSGLDSFILPTPSTTLALEIFGLRDEVDELEDDDATSVSLLLCVS